MPDTKLTDTAAKSYRPASDTRQEVAGNFELESAPGDDPSAQPATTLLDAQVQIRVAREELSERDRQLAVARDQVGQLAAWLDRLAAGVQSLLGSRRWQIGNSLVGLAGRFQGKPRNPIFVQQVQTSLEGYVKWLESIFEGVPSVRDTPDPSSLADAPRRVIESSGLFRADYYDERYPDVADSEIDALEHFLIHGASEGRWPNPYFNTLYYRRGSQIDPKEQNPLLHYILEGERRGLQPNPDFSPNEYLARNPDVARSGESPLRHYLREGSAQGRDAASRSPRRHESPRVDLSKLAIAIVIPVFNNEPCLKRCLEAVLRHTQLPDVTLILIDDASSCQRTAARVQEYADLAHVTAVRSESNRGFTASVNEGLRLAGSRDVVILNSDATVGARWLEGLALAAYSNFRSATATALSDNAGAFSTPEPSNNSTLSLLDVDSAARLSQRSATACSTPFPTGNGFCMYFRREAILDVGELDTVHFPRGYGAEDDFCMRASERGWNHQIALRSYAAHENAASFGAEKDELIALSSAQLARTHPGYADRVHFAIRAGGPLADQRERFSQALESLAPSVIRPIRPRALYVVSTRTGGLPMTNADLMDGIRHLHQPLLLTCDRFEMVLWDASDEDHCVLARHSLKDPVLLETHGSQEYDEVISNWLQSFQVELLHVRHIAWHSTQLARIAQSLGIGVVFSFHDFYCVCPSVNLTNGGSSWFPRGVTEGPLMSPLWDKADFDAFEGSTPEDFLQMWRRRMSAMFEDCDRLITTSRSCVEVVEDNFPELAGRIEIIPHGRDFLRFHKPISEPLESRKLRILVSGDITDSKGLQTVLRLVAIDRNRLLDIHVAGTGPTELQESTTFHGAYERDSFGDLVEAIRPDVALVLSIWPETWCHVLTECWAAGIPVVGSRLGAVGERIQRSGAGWAAEPNDPEAIYEILARIARLESDLRGRQLAVERWQGGDGAEQNIDAMVDDYARLYRSVAIQRRSFVNDDVDSSKL